MFSLENMPTTASTLFSAYASFAASMMLFRSVASEIIPAPIRSYLEAFLHRLFTPYTPSQATIVVEEQCGISTNEVYEAAELYLRTKISPMADRFKVGKTQKQKTLHIGVEKGEAIPDQFQEIHLKWQLVSNEPKDGLREKKSYELCFDKKFRDRVVNEYLPFVFSKANEIKNNDKPLKLYTRDIDSNDDDDDGGYNGDWGSITLDHPSTFKTLAMDPKMKANLMEDLDRFVRRREFYKKVGKAWKRGYLLFGPPGTGKSSLIAAMANYLKFNVYDLELSSIYSNSELRRILVSTNNRSIIVIEDIDCSVQMHNRDQTEDQEDSRSNSKLTLSGLLNFIDGLWSSCGDERIIIFTTNHRDRLDPALLRPGRMDMHIHMSYCTMEGFMILARNYLDIGDHDHVLFKEIKSLMETSEVTPAELAEELMKSEDSDVALAGVVEFLKRKKSPSAAAGKSEQSKPVTAQKEEMNKAKVKKLKGRKRKY
ncbi:AAA-ATPase At2g18193-like [Impatiens glandulifera]|uniref:AAA-ATPase At2g18193-like n=1 Tax=Impatiens glandulifera TaxID=253017 RepID=UPI001FB15FD6|nr:AAA-ATPase At2g18193-like [Impatiens glandulifera]